MRVFCLVLWLGLAGCRSTGPTHMPTERERVDMLSLMLPEQIKIEPFTRIASFDSDDVPDGVLAVIRAADRFGEPVKAAGYFYFELWTYQDANSERKGERLAYWDRTIATNEEVRLYWTRAGLLEFRLAWTRGLEAVKPNRKYILTAAYRPPWDETLRDEYVMEFVLPATAMTSGK